MRDRWEGGPGPAAMVARLGGDELAVLLPATDLARVRTTAAALLAACATAFAVDGHDVRVTLSVGGAQNTREPSASELLRAADRALYRAKRREGARADRQRRRMSRGRRADAPLSRPLASRARPRRTGRGGPDNP